VEYASAVPEGESLVTNASLKSGQAPQTRSYAPSVVGEPDDNL
jgi:hypothetical protein